MTAQLGSGRHAKVWDRYLQDARSNSERAFWSVALLVAIAAVALLDMQTGSRFDGFVLLRVPTILGVWKLGLVAGLALALLSTTVGVAIDLRFEPRAPASVALTNAVAGFTVFALVAWGSWRTRKLAQALLELTRTDSLTGLANRRALYLRGAEEVARMRRTGTPLSVAFMDLDGFKAVNDRFGHDIGDAVLKTAARSIRGRLRASDLAARVGGDEFALILPSTDGAGAVRVVDALCGDLAATIGSDGYSVTASAGVATFAEPPVTFERALGCADSLMYQAKRSARSRALHRDCDTGEGRRPTGCEAR